MTKLKDGRRGDAFLQTRTEDHQASPHDGHRKEVAPSGQEAKDRGARVVRSDAMIGPRASTILRWTPARISAYDRRRAALHEAGHAIIAQEFGWTEIEAWIYPNPNDLNEKSWLGHCRSRVGDRNMRSYVSVAGMVGEHIWSVHFDPDQCAWSDFADTLIDPRCMSEADWAGTGCDPAEPSDELVDIAVDVARMLQGHLRERWLAAGREIMSTGQHRGET